MANFMFLKKGDTYPNISTTLSDENGPVNLTGCTVLFRMSEPDTGNLMLETAATVLGQGTPENLGKCYAEWDTGDTDIIGEYRVEWVVTFPNGKKATFPRGDSANPSTAGVFNKVYIQNNVD